MAAEETQLDRVELMLKELLARPAPLDPNRAYADEEVCRFLAISRSTLWRIRKAGRLEAIELVPAEPGRGAAVIRTTGRQISEYLRERERAADVLSFTATGRRRNLGARADSNAA